MANPLTDLFKLLFKEQPELIDVSWTQKETEEGTEVDGLRFHIRQDDYEKVLDYSSTELREYINKFGPITPNSLDWNNSINNFDILDLKKDTELYKKIKDVNTEILSGELHVKGLVSIFGTNKKVVFSGEEFTISNL